MTRTLVGSAGLLIVLVLSTQISLGVELEEELHQVQLKIDQLDKVEQTPSAKQLKDVYQQTLAMLQAHQSDVEKARGYELDLKKQGALRTDLKQALLGQTERQAAPAVEGKSLHELERMQETASTEEIALQNQLNETQNRLAQLQARLLPAQIELSEAKSTLERSSSESKSAATPLESGLALALDQKRRHEREARIAHVHALELELISIPNQIELAGLKKDLLNQQLKNIAQYRQTLGAVVQRVRQQESETIAGESRQLLDQTQENPAMEWLANENVRLGDALKDYASKGQQISEQRAALEQQNKRIEQRYALLKQELELGGEVSELGELMRQTYQQLRSLGQENVAETINRIQKGQLQSLFYEREKAETLDREEFLQALDDRFNAARIARTESAARAHLNSLLELRLNLLNKLLDNNQAFLKELSLLLNTQNQLNDRIRQFNTLLTENLLWTASDPPIGVGWFADLRDSWAWMVDGPHWRRLGESLYTRVWLLAISFGLYFAALLCLHAYFFPRFALWQAKANAEKGNARRDSFMNTLKMLSGELLRQLPTPLLLIVSGRILMRANEDIGLLLMVGYGLRLSGRLGLVLGLLRQLARPGGFLEGQLRWSEIARASLYGTLRSRWLLILLFVCVLVTESQPDESLRGGLGRLAFLLFCIALALQGLNLRRGWRESTSRSQQASSGLIGMVPSAALAFAVIEFGLAVMELFGFHLGAVVLQKQVLLSLGWFVVIVLLYQMLERWLLLEQRRIAYAHAKAAQAERRANIEEGNSDDADLQSKRMEFAGIQSVSRQSQALLKLFAASCSIVALWWTWSDLIPALRLLDQVVLWHSGAASGAVGGIEVVTLKTLLIAVAGLVLVIAAARNLPGLLQLLVLERLTLEPGSNFALTTLFKYLIQVGGLIIIANYLGLRWAELQWLVAALGVGLGFGLQEIFANFISGLIVLFEKPVRIGDIITLSNGITGTVEDIKTRATTLKDWDNKGIVIPNKTLITEQVTNWSLSDPTLRLIIPVGIAYGSDTDLAQRLLLQVAHEHPLVLEKPEAVALFAAFGESSLNFELRCFIDGPQHRPRVTHELNMRIDKLFRERGIGIAFRQLDVHLKEMPAGTPEQS